MSEPESTDQFLPEEAAQSFDEVVQMSVPVSSIARHSRNNGNSHLTILPAPTAATLQTPRSNQEQHTSPDKDELRQDLAKIIARAREEISRLRQELTRLEAETARIAQERDSAQQKYKDLYDTFLETVHAVADEEIRRVAEDLQANPEHIPGLLEPIYSAITRWHDLQQAEREQILVRELETIEKQAERFREEILQERQALNLDRDKLVQQRQALHDQMQARSIALRTGWLAKTWSTSVLMFMVLPALQIYLLTQKASNWNIIIIPTTLCFVMLGGISLIRARKQPTPKK